MFLTVAINIVCYSQLKNSYMKDALLLLLSMCIDVNDPLSFKYYHDVFERGARLSSRILMHLRYHQSKL